MLVDEKAELALEVSRLDVKLFASKQEIDDLREKLELASMNQSVLQKERDSLIKERKRKMELSEKEHATGDSGHVADCILVFFFFGNALLFIDLRAAIFNRNREPPANLQ